MLDTLKKSIHILQNICLIVLQKLMKICIKYILAYMQIKSVSILSHTTDNPSDFTHFVPCRVQKLEPNEDY